MKPMTLGWMVWGMIVAVSAQAGELTCGDLRVVFEKDKPRGNPAYLKATLNEKFAQLGVSLLTNARVMETLWPNWIEISATEHNSTRAGVKWLSFRIQLAKKESGEWILHALQDRIGMDFGAATSWVSYQRETALHVAAQALVGVECTVTL